MIINESKAIDDMLDWIVKNRKYVDYEHQLEPVWESAVQKKFQDETGFYPKIQYGEFAISDLGWTYKAGRGNYATAYDRALADFKQFQEGSATSPKEMKETTEFKNLLEFVQLKSGDKITGIRDYMLGSFFRFLRYVMFGKLDKDLRQGNAIEDTLRVKEGFMNAVPDAFPFTKMPDLKNIQIKRFKNGALQIKGLGSRERDEFMRILKLTSRHYRN